MYFFFLFLLQILNGTAFLDKPDLVKASEKSNRSLASLHELSEFSEYARYKVTFFKYTILCNP